MPGFEWFDEKERQEVQDVLRTGVLFRYGFDHQRQGHWKAKTFERELSQRIGSKYCHLCSSGTAALNVALAASGVGAGDEVVVPPFTFIATIEAVLTAGAVPVFADIDDTLCLDPDAIANAITPRTKAVLCVHMCGAMAQVIEIKSFCDENGLLLIEDACQSLGATFNEKSVGTFGQAGCFSFDAVKTITCGEGGAVVTNDNTLYRTAEAYADHGHDHIGCDRGQENHPILGTNYRISELNAAVGLAQLRKLDRMLEVQRKHKKAIKGALSEWTGVSFRKIPDESGDSATFLSFCLAGEEKARQAHAALNRAGIDGCFYWYDNNWHYYRQWDHLKTLASPAGLPIEMFDYRPDYAAVDLARSDGIMRRTISMQIKLSWTPDELDGRIQKILETGKNLK